MKPALPSATALIVSMIFSAAGEASPPPSRGCNGVAEELRLGNEAIDRKELLRFDASVWRDRRKLIEALQSFEVSAKGSFKLRSQRPPSCGSANLSPQRESAGQIQLSEPAQWTTIRSMT